MLVVLPASSQLHYAGGVFYFQSTSTHLSALRESAAFCMVLLPNKHVAGILTLSAVTSL